MGLRRAIVLFALMEVTWSLSVTTIGPKTVSTDASAHPEPAEENTEQKEAAEEDVMATGELNPNHYPAQRAAKVVQHYLNLRHGSPYKLFGLKEVHSGNAEEVADSGRKYQLEISVHEIISNTKEKCSAEVFFPSGAKQLSPQVQVSSCEEILKLDAKSEEEALYQQYKTNKTVRTEKRLPDSYGHIDPEMTPFWHLSIVASSFIMLKESTENTLYNMAQVANITQLATENDQLKFDCHVLLHDMVSQEIPQWKLLFTWSPAEGVKVLHTEQLPHVHESEKQAKPN
ncbi:PREDICTED: latexin isoform X1 [Poecilia mexicana]|uniref:Cystatin LXN-type domain-containing protein n=2 Tax=Poecilia mexicana TaxID=48701 RepID=A0A3B3X5M8_9TELE|nr:PREDICTED: latexin isoform X1 [Poecilia mexicana]